MGRLVSTVLGDAAAGGRVDIRIMRTVGLLCCAAIPVFVVVTLLLGRFAAPVQYGTVLMLGLVAIFFLRPGPLAGRGAEQSRTDVAANVVLAAGAVAAWIYLAREYSDIASFREGLPNRNDLVAYAIGTFVVVIGAHRAEGWALSGVVLAAMGYLLFGHLLPGILEHRPFSVARVLETSYSYRGVFGVALASVVDIVLIFVVLGTALRVTGVGAFFTDLALMLTRGRRSGPAQCAIIASSLFGSINGSAPANVAATGVLTIPMMRRAGFQPRFAGGVEATASCVGQIMPPVMGVGAFIMSDVTGIPYVEIMLAAIVPAGLYILSLSITVALEAGRQGLAPAAFDVPPWDRARLSRAALLVLGFGTLLGMLFSGYPPTFCGLAATGVIVAVGMVLPDTRFGLADWTRFVVESGRDALPVILSCAAIGIVIAAIASTGLGIKLNQEITALGDENLLAALILAAGCSIVLGMGLPTAASYLMVIFVAGPAIMELGVSQLGTHMFVFYYAVLSAITPPVALAIFAAAAIAQVRPIPLAVTALRLALVGFVLPIAWVYHPEIMVGTQGTSVLDALLYAPFFLVAIAGLAAGNIGHFLGPVSVPERALLIGGAIIVLVPGWPTAVGGCALTLGIASIRIWKSRHVAPA